MKRNLSIMLSIVLISAMVFICSCATQTEETFDLDFSADYEPDLTGMTFRWGSAWYDQLVPTTFFSKAGDLVHKRINDLKEKYGCDFEAVEWEDGGSRVLTEFAAGYSTVDFLDCEAITGGIQLFRANLLYALEDIPNIDMTDGKYGTPRFLQYGIFDGKHYGFFHYRWENAPEYRGLLHFNSDMLRSLGVSSPHELRENGMWDWTNFKEYLLSIQTAAKDAGYDPGFVPYLCGQSYGEDAVGYMFANGLRMIDGSGNGQYSFGFDNSAGYAAVEFLTDLCREGLYRQGAGADFVKNKMSAMLSHESYYSTNYDEHRGNDAYLARQDYAYGLIRFPHGPNGTENSVSSHVHPGRRLNWILTQSGHETADMGLVMEFMFAPFGDSGGWAEMLEERILYTQDDYDEFIYMLDNINFSYGTIYLEKGYDTWLTDINRAVRGEKAISEVFSENKSAIQDAIDRNVNWTYDELTWK